MDAEELKNHKFFEGINWGDVMLRKLEHPKPKIKPIKLSKTPLEEWVYGPYANVGKVNPDKVDFMDTVVKDDYNWLQTEPIRHDLDRNKIPGWSFVGGGPENI